MPSVYFCPYCKVCQDVSKAKFCGNCAGDMDKLRLTNGSEHLCKMPGCYEVITKGIICSNCYRNAIKPKCDTGSFCSSYGAIKCVLKNGKISYHNLCASCHINPAR